MDSAHNTVELNAALSNPRDDIAKLDELEKKLFAFNYAANEIGSFGPCIDPKKAAEERGEALAILGEQIQETSVILLLAHCLTDFTRIALYLMRLIAHKLKFCAATEVSW